MESHNLFALSFATTRQAPFGNIPNRNRMPESRHNGFTLVEIMITIVIIGILFGGVLKARDMLLNTQLKRLESDNADVSAAIMVFRDRYGHFPGDHPSADLTFSVYTDGINDPAPADINGDESGTIDGNWIAAANTETSNIWKHLRAAELIGGSPDSDLPPYNAHGGRIGVRDGSLLLGGHVTILGSIDGKAARILEDKLDDGAPGTGLVQSDIAAPLMDGAVASSSANYVESQRYFMAFKM